MQKYVPTPLTSISGIQYGEANGIPLYLDLLCPYPLPATPLPTIVSIVCSGWQEAHRGWVMVPWGNPLFASHNFITVSVAPRLSGQAHFPAQIHDIKAVIRWLRAHAQQYSIDPDRIGVGGGSAAGHLAALLALTANNALLEGDNGSPGYSSAVQAVAITCAPSDFLRVGGLMINDVDSPVTRLFGGTVHEREELMHLASPLTHVHADAPPFLIVHGTHDETVPFEQGERLYQALLAAHTDVTFLPIQNAYHNLQEDPTLPWQGDVWYQMGQIELEFFQKHLCKKG